MMTRIEAKYTLFDSVEAMLAPETLSDILNQRVTRVACQPFAAPDGYSGSQLYHVMADDRRLFMKWLSYARDWKAIVTDDHRCRSVRVWQYGLLDRLQPHLDHGILAACEDGDDYAILMEDLSEGLFYGKPFTEQMMFRLLDALAAMHTMFWEDDSLHAPHLGLCSAEQSLKMCWTEHVPRYLHDKQTSSSITKGWKVLYELVEPDVRDALESLTNNLQPLLDVIDRYPRTLVHADYRTGNLALMPSTNQIVAFDWQDAGYEPANICLCWFLMSDSVFNMRDAAAEYYRGQLVQRLGSRFDVGRWQEMLDVGCLADVLRKGSWHALFAVSHKDATFRQHMRESVDAYNGIVRRGLKWL